jgi:hypothetical protein
MKCFNHPEKDAVAICKNCNKGLCPECTAEVNNGIACKGKCEEEVLFLDKMIQKNKTILNKTASAYYRSSVILIVFGVVFIIFGLKTFADMPPLQYFSWAMGIVMFFAALLTFISGRKIYDK